MLAATVALASLFGWLARSAPEPLGAGVPAPVVAGAPALAAPLVALEGALEAVTQGERREVQADEVLESVATTSVALRRSTVCRGRLVDGGMRPFAGALIELWRVQPREDGSTVEHAYATTRTDDRGEFELRDDVGDEGLVVRAQGDGFVHAERALPERNGALRVDHDMGIWSVPGFGLVRGRLLLDPKLTALGLTVVANGRSVPHAHAPVADDGTFAFIAPARGTYDLALSGSQWIGPRIDLWEGIEVRVEDDERAVNVGDWDLEGAVLESNLEVVAEGLDGPLLARRLGIGGVDRVLWDEVAFRRGIEWGVATLVHAAPTATGTLSAAQWLDASFDCAGEPLLVVLQPAPEIVFHVTVEGAPANLCKLFADRGEHRETMELVQGRARMWPSRLGKYSITVRPYEWPRDRDPEPSMEIDVAATPAVRDIDVVVPPGKFSGERR